MFWRRNNSKDVLKNRLKMVLAYDRAEMPSGKMESLRNDILEVVKRHFPGNNNLSLNVERRGDTVVLSADIPLE